MITCVFCYLASFNAMLVMVSVCVCVEISLLALGNCILSRCCLVHVFFPRMLVAESVVWLCVQSEKLFWCIFLFLCLKDYSVRVSPNKVPHRPRDL